MEEKNPGTDSKSSPNHGFKEATVPPVRFWILSVG
jgi:hypothetical protein